MADGGAFKVFHTSTIPEVTHVRLYDETLTKVVQGHGEFTITEIGLATATEQGLLKPKAYHRSATRPDDSYLIISDASTHLGNPIRIAVRMVTGTQGRVTTVYFADGTYSGALVWSASDE